MAGLSSPIENIKAEYTVVIVGSGYGAAIAASRMARAGQSVCVLERGREFLPGEFPETDHAALQEFQINAPEGHIGSPTGLFDVYLNPQVSVLVGCGLGGTSLINANVSIKPDSRVFRDGRWPKALVADWEILSAGYDHAAEMLRPEPYPEDWPRLPKMEAHRQSAEKMGRPFERVPINVTFRDGPSPAGVPQKKCVLCGNCVTGCNHRAKNMLTVNYLPDAKRHGAEIYTRASVRYIERHEDHWLVHYQVVGSEQQRYDAPTQFVRAALVILGAGTLGSTEILLRSREQGLTLSGALGNHFTGNGDMLSFSYNPVPDCNSIGWAGNAPPPNQPPVGPTITSAISVRPASSVKKDVLLEEGAIPSAIGAFASDALFGLAKLKDLLRGRGVPHEERSIAAAGRASQVYLAMSLDDDKGQVVLEHDRVSVRWAHAGTEPDLEEANVIARGASEAIGGTFLRDPLWTRIAGERLITVHPLGGCAMGDDAQTGVVDDKCRVYAGPSGTGVYPGLYVCDGSVIPSPLGVNPLFTISAITERACHYLSEERGWKIDYTLPDTVAPAPAPAPGRIGLQFTESMKGFFKIGVTDGNYQQGYAEGEASGSSCEFVLTIGTDDLDDMLCNPAHRARMLGTVQAPTLSAEPLTVTEGFFNLLTEEPDQPGYRFMRYCMRLTAESGRSYWFDGFKRIGNDSPTHAFYDATTLYVSIYDGPGPDAPLLGQGILKIGVEGVLKMLETLQAPGAHGFIQKAWAKTRFITSFLGTIALTYLHDLAGK